MVEQLEGALLAELVLRPGQTRAQLCATLSSHHEILDRPMINLVQSGRVTRTGHKESSRYWPTATPLGSQIAIRTAAARPG